MVKAGRPGLSRLGAVLAILAVFGFFALSSWHNAVVHDDDPVHLVSVEHDHGSPGQADPDAPIHVLAHATGQWVDITGPAPTPPTAIVGVAFWSVGVYRLLGEIEPTELLRPPRG